MVSNDAVTLVEVGPRDGFQPIGPLIPTATKIDYVTRLYDAGVRRMEATAFVSDRAVPQLADAAEVLTASQALPGLAVQVLVPNQRYCDKAIEAGATFISFVLSVSEKHNMNNVRRTTQDSVEEYARLVAGLPAGTRLRLNLATSFDCPFDGAVDPQAVIALLDQLVPIRSDAEIALCDTTGRTTPSHVRALFADAIARHAGPSWAFHGHDTYGLGVANVLAAHDAGARVFDSSFAGLGGCPFAPGATGNVATEDVVWTFGKMGISSGIDLDRLLDVAEDGVTIAGALSGGRVRNALHSQRCATGIA
ncbi:hydroxymethylglutaryl-CoA lyase [Sphingomonas sp. SRS2]|uniref:hydroxymethylglutaryl-CoA lyase n=1 Tax=Sphingomonas sp. SRS2 TaxID=133190 RepID=UPI0006184F93|nr:hydroxymethylglutaryl-CoA lyase [Sphingomonas sp. SRS2]KKC25198.1 pyruvate carboxyltransferase [Sphingomonas sp. SRS2]